MRGAFTTCNYKPRCSAGLVARAVASRAGRNAGERALLADPGLILPPYFQRLAAGVPRQRCVYEGGEVALKDARAAASCPGWRGWGASGGSAWNRGSDSISVQCG
jgi:hypothetical protein